MSRPKRFVSECALALLMMMPCLCWSADQSSAIAEIGAVTASSTKDGVVVEIQLKGSPSRTLFSELTGPSRLVIDFHGATPSTGFQKTSLAQGSVIAARTALFGTDDDGKAVTRVVLDLSSPTKFERRQEPGKLLLSARATGASAPVVRATLKTADASTVPVPKPSSLDVTQLEEMTVSQSANKTTVSLRLDQAVKPVVSVLSDPKRYVMDFPQTQFGAGWNHSGTFNLPTGPVSSIRAARFKMNPPVVRLVFDEAENAPKPMLTVSDRILTLTFENASGEPLQRHIAAQRGTDNFAMTESAPLESTAGVTTKARPPFVSYDRGMLFVDADNSNLPDILFAISQKTGAQIELPMAEGMLDRVGTRIGPATPREVIAKLLDGSIYNYIIVENSAGKLDEVLLSPKQPAEVPSN